MTVNKETTAQSDKDFFIMMASNHDPISGERKFFRRNNYYKILDKKDSEEFKRFIQIYNKNKYILKERQRQILDDLYGVDKPRSTLKEVGELHQISLNRVRSIRVDAENRLMWYLRGYLKKY